jgi:IS5 family transposase
LPLKPKPPKPPINHRQFQLSAGHARVRWHIAAKRGKIRALPEGPLEELHQQLERGNAQVRAKVEHAFAVVKNLFRHRKVRYRGLAKNLAQLYSLFGLANLYKVRHALAA